MKKILFLCIITLLAASCNKGPQANGNEQDKPSGDNVGAVQTTAMAVVNIVTDDNAPIVSKEEYIKANVTITTADGVTTDVMRTNIRGRGNSSWYSAEKKSYRLKFDEKQSLLGRGKDKSWSLIANYFDKTLLRNELAFHMSRLSRLAYTPATDYVEVYLNGSYEGVYVLCDHLKTGSHRMDADYLMEIDVRAEEEDIQVHLTYLGQPVVVKDPDDISYDSEEYTYISGFLTAAENALYSPAYTSPDTGYRQYFDLDSFVDWYLINEIAKNNDAVLYTSCYMNHNEGGKLCMGPVWDFDIAFGNVNYNDNDKPEGVWIEGWQSTGLDVQNNGLMEVTSMAWYQANAQGTTKDEAKAADLCGVYADGVITFPVKGLAIAVGGGAYYGNENGAFALDMTNLLDSLPEEGGESAAPVRSARVRIDKSTIKATGCLIEKSPKLIK